MVRWLTVYDPYGGQPIVHRTDAAQVGSCRRTARTWCDVRYRYHGSVDLYPSQLSWPVVLLYLFALPSLS